MKSKIMPSIVLGTICVVVALLLSIVNIFTADIIAEGIRKKEQAAMEEIIEGGSSAVSVYEDIKALGSDKKLSGAYLAEGKGYIFRVEVTGYSTGMVVMVGIGLDGKIIKTQCTQNSETPTKADPVFMLTEESGAYIGKDAASFAPALVAGSTMTSEAYAEAVKIALESYTLLQGGAE